MTMPESSNTDVYYYAGGKRIDLKIADDLLAVDRHRLAADFPTFMIPTNSLNIGTELVLVSRSSIEDTTIETLFSSGLTRPVYRQSGSILVLSPEIRIECPDDKTLENVVASLANHPEINITRSSGRASLALTTNQANETLTLANHLYESHPGLSITPRFLRVVESPNLAT